MQQKTLCIDQEGLTNLYYMKNKTTMALGLIILVIILLSVLVYQNRWFSQKSVSTPEDAFSCTADAKLCTDGSYVGRSGPKCEFAECPVGATKEAKSRVVGFNQIVSTNGVNITALDLVEDSRCPNDVTCIQAGTVKIRAKLESEGSNQTVILSLDNPVTFVGKQVTLISVEPATNSKIEIKDSEYRFQFIAN